MKPAPFTYHRPATLEAAVALQASLGDEAKLLAGGQSLGPMLNMRLACPAALIDLNGVSELAGISLAGAGLEIGALTRHHAIEHDATVRAACPLLAEAAALIGHYAIRQRGTIGGSLAHADPAAQFPLTAVTLGAEIIVAGPNGRRTIPAADFFLSIMTTALEPDEILAAIRFPVMRSGEGWAYRQFSRRHGDFAIVATAATAVVDGAGRLSRLRLGLGGVGPVPLAIDVGALVGHPAEDAVAGAIAAAQAAADPEDDARLSAAYRRDLIDELVRRAVSGAIARSRGE